MNILTGCKVKVKNRHGGLVSGIIDSLSPFQIPVSSSNRSFVNLVNAYWIKFPDGSVELYEEPDIVFDFNSLIEPQSHRGSISTYEGRPNEIPGHAYWCSTKKGD